MLLAPRRYTPARGLQLQATPAVQAWLQAVQAWLQARVAPGSAGGPIEAPPRGRWRCVPERSASQEVKRENTLAQLANVADSRRKRLLQVAQLIVGLFELEKSGF